MRKCASLHHTSGYMPGSIGDLNGSEDPSDDVSISGEEGGASDQEDSAECDGSSPPSCTPLYNEEPRTHESLAGPEEVEEDEKGHKRCTKDEEEEDGEREEEPQWNGPDDLMLSKGADDLKVLALRDLSADTVWGPFSGSIQSEEPTDGLASENPVISLECEDADCWLRKVPVTSCATDSNCTIYIQEGALFCKLTQELSSGDALLAMLSSSNVDQSMATQTPSVLVKEEPEYPAALHSEIQLLPQQAGMAAILATAVINKDIFPCKDCGIWYRSERNLQAHLMYYCASRQKQQTGASPPQDKPKDSYPNERLCHFPHCNKSCPSASSLEIHMRTHSGERPFVCLICLSAFTTKANCERHLKVHTDSLNGVCHGCGFISTTRDILYSHLVISHMVCQPGSRSEVYSPKLPLAKGLSPGDSGIVLKCQVCGYSADTPALLQQHVHTHLEVRVPAERSPTPRQSSPFSTELPEMQNREPAACVPRPDSSSPGANGSSATSHGCSPSNPLNIKEEPRSDYENDSKEEEKQVGSPQRHAVEASSSQSTSHKSPLVVAVKAEPTSPTPGSSPVHPETGGSVLPGGALFLPQYMFNSEAAIMPQASEILAKMSEMVHSRLKQGQGPAAGQQGFFPPGSSASVPKGATCFECDITFNNINNFYVHKRLYCSSRHQQGEAAGLLKEGAAATAAPPAAHAASPQARPVSRAASASPNYSDPATGSTASEPKLVEVKSEDPGLKETTCSSSSEGEGAGGGQVSEGSQSPSGSAEDADDDPNRTFCQACNIHFSRHDNYIVHKRFYCASRHDPTNQRSHSGKAAFLPQPIRTRKRKKMYEIHMAQSEALANATALTSATSLGVKQEGTGGPSIPSLSQVSTPTRGSSPEGDGPIDLSKRPRIRENQRRSSIADLPLTDYHKCTACSISFNSIENYLAHKTYYCPATTLQPHTLEQLNRLKRPASTSPKNRAVDLHPDVKGHQTGITEAVAHPSALPGPESTSPNSAHGAKTPSTSPVVCPYCPPNRLPTCDLVEHFKTVHGLVLALKQHPETQSAGVSPSPSLSPRDGAPLSPPKPSPCPRRDSVNGRSIKLEATSPSSPVLNGSPLEPQSVGAGSPKNTPHGSISPTGDSLTVSPMPEAVREVGQMGYTPMPLPLPEKVALVLSHAHPSPAMPKTSLASPVQNGNTRYCRLCNIKFSSLSTFIAHKKYYCSSHSAEHVK
ncbi:zinc finger protein ZFPM1-like isoform X2 [Myxocyprinus asiaticus]|uniref:zinc finger protein ZFPM1-like isoform X2 n=1 Tax=Myxocyprinus asiaticus TaxID=70543 RepID=UPI0022215533|nr:zinc finger protein ZFPM1-like isoform X2 [Myxocyprinus asiaticus]